MKTLQLTCLFVLATRFSVAEASRLDMHLSPNAGEQIRKECGVDFSVPKDYRALLVDDHPDGVRCIISLVSKTREGRTVSEKGLSEGYRENADAVLLFKTQPISSILPEFNFALDTTSISAVKYIGQPLTFSAKRLGYSQETVTKFSVSSKNRGNLLVAEAEVPQRKANGNIVLHQRLDVVWGNDELSVGATIWCGPLKPRKCALYKGVRNLFESLTLD
jgi:hypothetical protein